MITFREYRERLDEIFTDTYDYRWAKKAEFEWSGVFKKGDVQVEIMLFANPDTWELVFTRGKHSSIELTGEGDAFKIFATVMKMGSEFVKARQPKVIQFRADKGDGESRASLYRRMAKKYMPSNYELEEEETQFHWEDYASALFTLTRKT